MDVHFKISGIGHSVGSKSVSNKDVAISLGLESNWFERRTGISKRRVCADGENVLGLGTEAIKNACTDARLDRRSFGHETVLLHIQNGFTHLTPPPGILLCHALGFDKVRSLSLDGVCSEPINAIEIAALMLEKSTCERVIISAAVDFIPMIDPTDLDTVGLFGAGAGALILERCDTGSPSGLKGLYWENQTRYWDLGIIPVLGYTQENEGISIQFGYYQMKGTELARVTLKSVSRVIDQVLSQAGWQMKDIDFIITHQPNLKMLEIGIKKLKLPPSIIDMPVVELGNMGPASLLVALSIAKEKNRIAHLSRVLLVSFGLGFSCSGAALEL